MSDRLVARVSRARVFKIIGDLDNPWVGVRPGFLRRMFRTQPQALRFALGGDPCAACCPDDCTGCWCSSAGACWHHR